MEKYCPISFAGPCNEHCAEKRCSWWDTEADRCAILTFLKK